MWLTNCILLIPERYLKVDLDKTIKKCPSIKEWAYIYHDTDDGYPKVGKHYHVYLNFIDKYVKREWIASWFKIPEYLVCKSFLNRLETLTAFTHLTKCMDNLKQYKLSDLHFKCYCKDK